MKRLPATCKHNTTQNRQQHSARSGAVAMILVVAVTMIGTVLLTQGVRSVVSERRAMPAMLQQQQAKHLLQVGLRKLKALPSLNDVQPGVWQFAKGILHTGQTGELKVTVAGGIVTISARYPLESDTPISVSQTLTKDDWTIQLETDERRR